MFKLLLAILVSATLDSTTLPIGDQTEVHLKVQAAADQKVQFPIYENMLIPEVEIINKSAVQSAKLSDGRVEYNQNLTITSFRDSLYSIPGIAFTVGGDTFYSDPLTLNVVQPFELDTSMAVTDIKPILKAPFWLWGTARWALFGVGVLALGIGIYFLVRMLLRRRNGVHFEKAIPARPAEEVALERLDQIKEQKLWQNGKTKQYHTELTDVVRAYIAARYDIHSTEKTSDETLREVKPMLSEQPDLFQRLKHMLNLADLVKFAKWTTTPDENEQALTTAYEFVNKTMNKPQENDIS